MGIFYVGPPPPHSGYGNGHVESGHTGRDHPPYPFPSEYAESGVCLFASDRPPGRREGLTIYRPEFVFEEELVEEELWELAAGEQVRALGLSQSDHYVTKNEFCLAMLVRMEKISEEDLRSCQAAFAKLDATETGRLDQHDLREHKRRGAARRAAADASSDAA